MSHTNSQFNAAGLQVVPFRSAEESWFWFMAAQAAKNDGAKFSAGVGLYPRPCEPVDILKTLDRLYRQRLLMRDHLLVLRHYGQRKMAPDPYRPQEARAATLWTQAMQRLDNALERKGIVESRIQQVAMQPRTHACQLGAETS